jgi:hypothetical protein
MNNQKPRRFYISGPITGRLNNNAAEFNAAALLLQNLGHEYVNPLDLDVTEPVEGIEGYNEAYFKVLRRDVRHLMDCDGVVVLEDWTKSKGAVIEIIIANHLRMPVYRIVDGALRKIPTEEPTITVQD